MVYTKQGPKNSGRKGQYVGHHWYDDIEVLPDDQRGDLPMTIAHDWVREHMFGCECIGCAAYPKDLLLRLKRRFRYERPGPR